VSTQWIVLVWFIKYAQVYLRCCGDPIWLSRIENRVPRIRIITRSLESEKIGSLDSEKSGPYRSTPGM